MSTMHVTLPPLRDGERITREEFLRRWEAMPELKNAELIDGIVHLSSPVGFYHAKNTGPARLIEVVQQRIASQEHGEFVRLLNAAKDQSRK